MKHNELAISVIIPVFNEELAIFDCINALRAQTFPIFEIIVIDNNSTDKTTQIISSFKGVKLLHESRQGQTFAQQCGFKAANGNILARIDADTLVPTDWAQSLANVFNNDPDIDAVTGYGRSRSGITIPLVSRLWSKGYFAYSRALFGSDMLWGSNMAMRKKAWNIAKPLTYTGTVRVHEDQDISLALHASGYKIVVMPELMVSVDFKGMMYFPKYWLYNKMQISTLKIHLQTRHKQRSNLTAEYTIQTRLLLFMLTAPIVVGWGLFALVNTGLSTVGVFVKKLILVTDFSRRKLASIKWGLF